MVKDSTDNTELTGKDCDTNTYVPAFRLHGMTYNNKNRFEIFQRKRYSYS